VATGPVGEDGRKAGTVKGREPQKKKDLLPEVLSKESAMELRFEGGMKKKRDLL